MGGLGEEEVQEGEEEEEVEEVEESLILQVDGADTDCSSGASVYDTEDEAFNEREPAVLVPAATQPPAGKSGQRWPGWRPHCE